MSREDGAVGWHVHRAERADTLVGPLADLLAVPPADPFTPDVVAVPTRGVERWLTHGLSHRLGATGDGGGVCANVRLPALGHLIGDVLAQVLTTDTATTMATATAISAGTGTDGDPWQPDRLTWAVLAVLDGTPGQPWRAVLDRHVGAGDPPGSHRHGRRYALARHLARLFAAYSTQRPGLVREWAVGRDTDGTGRPVPPDLAWQPELWRQVRATVGRPSPAERLPDAVTALREDPARVDLPDRVNVWGPTRLAEGDLDVLAALAHGRAVHLWLPHPSPALWDTLTRHHRSTPGDGRRGDHQPRAAHPLTAALGRDTTELTGRLAATRTTTPGTDHHHPAPDPPAVLLGHLQRQLRDDDPDPTPWPLRAGDDSVQVHACHGPTRQVEVLRDVVLHLLAADPTLEPRDVLVLCPDVETMAPLITAAFGPTGAGRHLPADGATPAVRATSGQPTTAAPGDPHPGHRLRVRIADRAATRTDPVLDVLTRLLDLADGRVTAGDVLALLATGPVRRRFGFTDDDLTRVRDWTVSAGARWGEDRDRRTRFGLPQVGQGTWEAALDRVLLGVVMADEDDRWLGTAIPLDDVDGSDLDLAGRFAELLDRLTVVLADLDAVDHPRPLHHWTAALDHAVDLLTDPDPAAPWQALTTRRVLDRITTGASAHPDTPLRLADVRALLAEHLAARPTRASFRTGDLTVCSMTPMRSVPHRVVCLLGLDDGTYPRAATADGDDVLLRGPLVGERDGRSEDQQIVLDAVLAARDHLVVLYSGADERTGATRPPAVPVGQLLDTIDRTTTTPTGTARDVVLTRHPLQPFDPRVFRPGALHTTGPAGFDPAACAGARVAAGPRTPLGPFLPRPLPPPNPAGATAHQVVDLDDLVRFLLHPARAFLRDRLGVDRGPDTPDDVTDRIPLEAAGLTAWRIGDRLLRSRLAGADPGTAVQAERRRGEVPPGALGTRTLDRIGPVVDAVTAAAAQHPGPPEAVDVAVPLPDGRTLTGTVTVHDRTVLTATHALIRPGDRLRAWLHLLALAATHPDGQWTAVVLGQGREVRGRPTVRRYRLTPPATDPAAALLAGLVDLRDRGRSEPLPLPVRTAHAYAAARHGGDTVDDAEQTAAGTWQGDWKVPGEAADPAHSTVWGSGADLGVLTRRPPPAGEATGRPDEPSWFAVLARDLWEPLLRHEDGDLL